MSAREFGENARAFQVELKAIYLVETSDTLACTCTHRLLTSTPSTHLDGECPRRQGVRVDDADVVPSGLDSVEEHLPFVRRSNSRHPIRLC